MLDVFQSYTYKLKYAKEKVIFQFIVYFILRSLSAISVKYSLSLNKLI